MKLIKNILILSGFLALCQIPVRAMTPTPVLMPTAVVASSAAAAGAAATVTISSPVATTYSTGLYTYITNIRIEMYATSALTGGATPVVCTTTNIPSNPTFKFPTAQAVGTMTVTGLSEDTPIATTSSGVNTVVTCPATSNVIWNIIVTYYIAQ